MKKTFLKNIFKDQSKTSFYATVVKRIKAGRYQLRGDDGGLLLADSVSHWPPGSRVAVQGDRIITGGGTVPNMKTYKV